MTDTTEQLPVVALPVFIYGFGAVAMAVALALFGYWARLFLVSGILAIGLGIAVCLPALIREERARRAESSTTQVRR